MLGPSSRVVGEGFFLFFITWADRVETSTAGRYVLDRVEVMETMIRVYHEAMTPSRGCRGATRA